MRQETHPDEFEDLRGTVLWFGARKRTLGTVGYLRFPEPHLPDMLMADSGPYAERSCVSTRPSGQRTR
ncbi:hypothetical protein [Streptomyces sp. EMB26]